MYQSRVPEYLLGGTTSPTSGLEYVRKQCTEFKKFQTLTALIIIELIYTELEACEWIYKNTLENYHNRLQERNIDKSGGVCEKNYLK